MAGYSVTDTGFTVLYEPDHGETIADIIFIHGLQGHPYKTWACKKYEPSPEPPASKRTEARSSKQNAKKMLRRLIPRQSKGSESIIGDGDLAGVDQELLNTENLPGKRNSTSSALPLPTYWPADLLPTDCPKTRILTWGYDTKVTKYMTASVNQNSIFSHAKDLLFSLERKRYHNRPIIFVVHSLGGILLKEMLAQAYMSTSPVFLNILESTRAVVFLGTPHRGSKDWAGPGDIARKVASAVMMDTNSAMLDSLGLKNSDLERCQDAFSRLWSSYGFRVKTFQEGFPLTGVKIGMLNEKIVPAFSSLLGDPRERAETINANHMEMCRFGNANDPEYQKVAGELSAICALLPRGGEINSIGLDIEGLGSEKQVRDFTAVEKACLQSLHFAEIETRRHTIDTPLEGTCLWLLNNPLYQAWRNRQGLESHQGLLWIKGNPGSGKSTLMMGASRQIEQQKTAENFYLIRFFFNSSGKSLERNALGLFRSIIYQLLLQSREAFREFLAVYRQLEKYRSEPITWHIAELKSFIQSLFLNHTIRRTVIFIDAIDEIEGDGMRNIVYFFRNLTTTACKAGVELDICLSSRLYPTVTISLSPVILMEEFNRPDITHYVEQRLTNGDVRNGDTYANLFSGILDKSSGVFLWVVLVVDLLLRDRDNGKNVKYLEGRLREVPKPLEDLFTQILAGIDAKDLPMTTRFFQWALLAGRTLRLREWHHILGFIRDKPPQSLEQWRESEDYTEDEQQLERQIRRISRGLVEVKTQPVTSSHAAHLNDWNSILAGAGSQDADHSENRVVQFIHESVQEFFLHGGGFSFLDSTLEFNAIGQGHISILNTCLDYIAIKELDALVRGRANAKSRISASPASSNNSERQTRGQTDERRAIPRKRTASVASFGTSASNYARSAHSNTSMNNNREIAAAAGSSAPGDSVWELIKDGKVNNATLPFHKTKATIGKTNDVASSALVGLESRDAVAEDFTFALKQFLNDPVTAAPPEALEEALAWASTAQSVTGQSQILEDFPALLSYASDMVGPHALLAEKEKIDPKPIVKRLINQSIWERFASLNEDIPTKATLIYFAAEWNLPSWISCLQEFSDLVERVEDTRSSANFDPPLIVAANRSNKEAMSMILKHWGGVEKCDRKGRIALHHIAAASDVSVLDELWTYMESECTPAVRSSFVNIPDHFGQTALHLAVWQSHEDMVKGLIIRGSDVNVKDSNGDTPLHFACEQESPNVVICQLLLASGANTFAENHQLKMPLQVSSDSGFEEAIRLIIAHQRKAGLISSTAQEPRGLLTVNIVEARGLQKCREPYVIVTFQKNEFVSEIRHEQEEDNNDNGVPLDIIDSGTRESNNRRSPWATTLRSRASSNSSVASLGDHRNTKLGAVSKLMTHLRWDTDANFDVVGSDTLLDIAIYDRGTSGSLQEEFLGRVEIELRLFENNDPIRGWSPLKSYSDSSFVPTGEIYVDVSFKQTINQSYGLEHFQVLRSIGKGDRGQVYQVRKKGTKRIYAMKTVSKKIITSESVSRLSIEATNGMVRVRTSLTKSVFIVDPKFSFETPSGDLCLVSDYMSGGDLLWHLQKDGRFEESRARFYLAEIILGLEHLRVQNAGYYELKPQKILFDGTGHINLSDFGISKLDPHKKGNAYNDHTPPGVLLDDAEELSSGISEFWTLGILTFEMCCGWSPFYDEDSTQMYKNIYFGKIRFPRDTLSREGRDFVKGLLVRNPKHRLGAIDGVQELKRHPFFASIDWDALAQRQIQPPFKPRSKTEVDFSLDDEFSVSASLRERVAALAGGGGVQGHLSPIL